MNERIKLLAEQAGYHPDVYALCQPGMEKFAELIIEQCCRALNPMLRDMISRGQGQELIKEHFGIEK